MTQALRPSYFPDIARDSTELVKAPPTATQGVGLAPQTAGIAEWMNWALRGNTKWQRHFDNAAQWTDLFDAGAAVVDGSLIAFPLADTLSPAPIAGGVIMVNGKRFDLSYPAIAAKYPGGALVWPSNTSRYLMARAAEGSSSSLAELKVGADPEEVGWTPIVIVQTGVFGITSVTPYYSTAHGKVTARHKWVFGDTVEFVGGVTYNADVQVNADLGVTGSGTFGKGITVDNLANAARIVALLGDSSASAFKTILGAGACSGLDAAMVESPGSAVAATADAASSGDVLSAINQGSGRSLYIQQSLGTNVTAAQITGGTQQALLATGIGAGSGATLRSGPGLGGNGLTAYAQNVMGHGVFGYTISNGDASARGVRGWGRGFASGGEFFSDARWGAIIAGKAAAPSHAALRIMEQSARPTDTNAGQITVVSGEGFVVSDELDAAYRGIWTSRGGCAIGVITGVNAANIFGGYTEVATCISSAGNAPKFAGGVVTMRLSCSALQVTNTSAVLNVQVKDQTTMLAVFTRSGTGAGTGAGYYLPPVTAPDLAGWLSINVTFRLTIPAAGARSWKVYFGLVGSAPTTVRDVALEFVGMT